GLALCRNHGELAVIADDEPGAVSAGFEPVHLAGELAHSTFGKVETLEYRARRVVVRLRAADAEVACHRLAQPGQPLLHRAQTRVPCPGHGERDHTVGHPGGLHRHRRNVLPVAAGRVVGASSARTRRLAASRGYSRAFVRGLADGPPAKFGCEG